MTQDDGRVLERWVFETHIDEPKPECVNMIYSNSRRVFKRATYPIERTPQLSSKWIVK